ncbi:hypothetical protein MJG53_020045 [Ovis ammon polii x Ovis aries]|uniref:Uncharacterized protein n=1 Tax=Ovis ammon polii x Ovis aries TaxID=2918886 RepID=A0ACB9U1K1_9CETA|nr:hypothetical protein MJG53_020045 [Ovis ammon polii x Ovis aries]
MKSNLSKKKLQDQEEENHSDDCSSGSSFHHFTHTYPVVMKAFLEMKCGGGGAYCGPVLLAMSGEAQDLRHLEELTGESPTAERAFNYRLSLGVTPMGQLPKPIFWIQTETSPLPGCNVNILCHGWLQDLVFMLFKEGYAEPVDYQVPTGRVAIFSIANMTPESEGVYICRTHIQMLPTLWSEPSNPLKLIVADKPPKPSLSAWPSTVFKLGKAITLQCRVPHPVLEFCLEWEERATSPKFSVDGDFIISNVEGKGAGTYSCSYRIEAHPNIWSHRSEPLKLMGPADILPKPVISASPPIRGQELQIRCKGWLAGMGFALYKEGMQEPVQQLGAVGREGFFTIRRMEDKDEGNYSCRTHTEKRPFKWSEPSEPLELVIKEMYPKPFFETWTSPVVTPGSRVTFNCSTPHQHMSFILYKDGSEVASSDSSWASLGASAAHFLIISVGIGDGGNYSCRYYDFAIWSEPSDPVELVVTEFYPKPTLLAQPGPVVLPGKNVTLRCQGAFQGMRFALLQEGTLGPLQFRSASGNSADFLLHTVGAEDSGNYSCVYFETTMSNRGSYLSKPLMIWVTDKPPKPSLSASPGTVFKLGKDITLQCRGPLPGVEFVLEHDGEEAPQQFSEDGDFVINNVEGKGIGNYSCSYRLQAYPDIWSEPSDTLELVGAAGPAAQECTVGNIVRSTLIVVVVVALGVVLAIEWKKWPRLRTRGSETDGRDQTIALEECNQEGDLGTNTNSPSSVSQGTSVEQPVPI